MRTRVVLAILFVVVLVIPDTDGWWWGSRRRRTRSSNVYHCNCRHNLKELFHLLKTKWRGVGRRDLAAMMDVDENYPGLDHFMHHADTKRDGFIDMDEFVSVLKRTAPTVDRRSCHCGRSLIDQANLKLQ